ILPPDIEKIEPREVVALFSKCMEFVLKRNDHKRHWNNNSMRELHARLRDECDELLWELLRHDFHKSEGCGNHIVGPDLCCIANEAIDIANFAMMIWDKAQKMLEEELKKNE
ncbi:MAG: hypothetical protein PHN44_10890, partial [Candidatus Marinimicrobia bacterium]|nr:hypothetical protein [Candidatus Neomarinimicrobiota bacterium]